MMQATEKLAVLFADISGSTALYEHLGDALARRLIAHCIRDICAEISKQQGLLIKTLGDEVMCVFPNAEQAFHAARAMQNAVQNGVYEGGHKMAVRIGFHFGEVIHEAGDVFGDTVNVAARITAIARAGEIMTSLVVVDRLPFEWRMHTRQVLRAEFKGKQERLDVFLVMWERDDGTRTRIGIPAYRNAPHSKDKLVLKYRDQTAEVSKTNRMVVLGRDKSCEIVVSGEFASRRHVCIELRFDQFVLMDQSTNGTYVQPQGGELKYLLREEMVLQGVGTISFDKPDSLAPAASLIAYVIDTSGN